ncbi:MAG: RagB/SusD family nutrient uptake outer membrane protein [Bacteroidales bacterium]|nr:RagB/SusD family nutrient uptake outer membrane protein [Bacteroidales bacterium]
MKLHTFIPALACTLLLGGVATSCLSDKDFLTEKPKAQLTIANAYNTSDQVVNTLLTGYFEFEELFFPNAMGQGIAYNTSTGTDMTDNKYQLGMGSHMSNFTAAWSADSDLPKSLWDKFYKIISYANLALIKIDEVEWSSEAEKSRVAAEAKFLRGLAYLRLGELFGGVPMVLEYTETPNYAYERASRSETYAAAIDDLKAAYAGLPWDVKAEYGRAGKGAAGMFLAEAYLADGVESNDNKTSYDEAAKVAREVIAHHPLMTGRFGVRLPDAAGSNYGIPNAYPEGNVMSDLFVAQNIISAANTEAIWVMVSAPDYATFTANGGEFFNPTPGGRRCCTLGFTPALQDYNWAPEYAETGAAAGPWKAFSAKYGGEMSPATHGGTGWAQSTPTWFASYTMWDDEHNNNSLGNDLRYIEDVTVKTEYMCCDENHSLYEQKVGWDQIDHSTPELAGIFFPIWYKETPFDLWDYDPADPGFSWFGKYINFYRSKYAARTSEVYLLLAEALLRGGDKAGALDALNAVRERANANPFGDIDINTILDERGRELLYEEFRWATFLRMKPAEWKARINDYSMYHARSGAEVYPAIRRWAEDADDIKFDLFPIPQTYIDLNTGAKLEQNAGWTK